LEVIWQFFRFVRVGVASELTSDTLIPCTEAIVALTCNPEILSVQNQGEAKRIILTPEDSSTESRWATETPMVADLVARHCGLGSGSVVLDYGCGIGRGAKN
jgi:hypothetical protein